MLLTLRICSVQIFLLLSHDLLSSNEDGSSDGVRRRLSEVSFVALVPHHLLAVGDAHRAKALARIAQLALDGDSGRCRSIALSGSPARRLSYRNERCDFAKVALGHDYKHALGVSRVFTRGQRVEEPLHVSVDFM